MKALKKAVDGALNSREAGRFPSALTRRSIENTYFNLSFTKQLTTSSEPTSFNTSNYNEHVRVVCLQRFKLTAREVECYFLLARGYRAKEIARVLSISHRTVEKHIENIKSKLQCNTLASIINLVSQLLFDEKTE